MTKYTSIFTYIYKYYNNNNNETKTSTQHSIFTFTFLLSCGNFTENIWINLLLVTKSIPVIIGSLFGIQPHKLDNIIQCNNTE